MIQYVLDNKNFGLKFEPTGNTKKPWEIACFSDSNLVSRRSVSDYIIYILGVIVSLQSNTQKSVTLLSSDAEWIALSEAGKEVTFMIQLLRNTNISVKLPAMVRIDIVGAILMDNNITTSLELNMST